MKIIVAGSRGVTDYRAVEDAIVQSGLLDDGAEIVSGMAKGVDTLAIEFAKKNNLPVHEFPADWEKLGKGAGYVRNREMADFADALIAVWDGKSKGTKMMIETAVSKDLIVFVKRTDNNSVRTFLPHTVKGGG